MQGILLGLAARPRVPLPPGSSPSFRRFVQRHSGPADDRYLYLRLGETLAPRGASMPLGAIILLDRRADGPAVLAAAARADVLKALITQNFARSEPAAALLDRLHRLMNRLPCLALRYSDLDAAADLLEQTFSAWPPDASRIQAAPYPLDHDSRETAAEAPASHGGTAFRDAPESSWTWHRHPDVSIREVEGEAFLTARDGTAIFHLNQMGTGLWNLFADGVSRDEAVAVLRGAFPDIDPQMLARDIDTLLAALATRSLVVAANEPAATTT